MSAVGDKTTSKEDPFNDSPRNVLGGLRSPYNERMLA